VIAVAPQLRRSAQANRPLLVSLNVLLLTVILGIVTIPGFWSLLTLRSLLLLASFLGIASIGQTVCALLGGLDLSIPFVIGAADLGTLWLLNHHVPQWQALLLVAAVCVASGALGGLISYRLRGQSVVVTLGVGYVLLGVAQLVISHNSQTGESVFGTVPKWLVSATSVSSGFLGNTPPAAVVWLALTALVAFALRRTWLGRGIYALGGNRVAAGRLLVPERRIWILVFAQSALTAATTGVLLLGFSAGAVADAGDPYPFTTVAAVVIGGTSLLGGHGGIGYTVVGVCILTVINMLLIGWGFNAPAQQVIIGLLIVPVVAMYGRAPHPRMRV
jgi:ribose transport system permease protein